jgi:lambda family phage tail tape measure protein
MKDFALTVIDSLAQIAAQELANSIIGGLFSVVGGIGSTASSSSSSLFTGSTNLATNAVNLEDFFKGSFSSTQFAKGGIPDVGSTPALFQLGSLREEGPEAILPLKRSSNGDLGVVAVGGTGASGVSIGSINISVVEKEDSTTEEQAAAISKAVNQQLKSLIDGRIANSAREGNMLNPTYAQGVF